MTFFSNDMDEFCFLHFEKNMMILMIDEITEKNNLTTLITKQEEQTIQSLYRELLLEVE